MTQLALSPCASIVRTYDYDRYLCTLFAPEPVREAWFALFAFNHEIATIPELAREEIIGFMRYAWWREVLEEIYGNKPVRRHPVVQALAETVRAHSLPRAPFDALIDAREQRLGAEPFATLELWEAYFRATSSGLLVLCAQVAGTEPIPALDELGIIWGCTGTARMTGDASLREAARRHLQALPALAGPFAAFRDMAAFYLKRLEKGLKTGPEARGPLMVSLSLRSILRRIRGKAG